eukprot:TRINITY_DN71110_c0_g1_i1.p1 TRINITY_DN71110_c0_g1~~TRINITY_DN71110_c0_g1_i1.p1  ORF type:complete len:484 (+),score=240.04 TRINITY_DN71110_c0_g1_i1:97-1548(+)
MPGDVEMADASKEAEEPEHPLMVRTKEGQELMQSAAPKALEIFRGVIATDVAADDQRAIRAKEQAVYGAGEIYAEQKNVPEVKKLLDTCRSFFKIIAKSKTAKIVRKLFDYVARAGCDVQEEIELVEELIAWCRQEKRTFMRQRLQLRLAALRFRTQRYPEALQIINALLREVRRLDDKAMLVDVHVLESRVFYALKNQSKAKAGLVAARTAAHTIYIPPLVQAEIDMQSGIIGAEEGDFRLSFSYFYEAFEGYHGTGEHRKEAEQALTYMLMSKILDEHLDDLHNIMAQKSVLPYRDHRAVVALNAIADAHRASDLHRFNSTRSEYADVLSADGTLSRHLEDLYNKLLERHLLRIIEPYERVQIMHIAKQIGLSDVIIESKLSTMILDKKLKGILDQANRCVNVFDDTEADSTYPDALDTISQLHKVVDALIDKDAGKFIKKKEEKKDEKKDDKDEKKDEKKDGDAKEEKKEGDAKEEKKGK